MAVAGACWGMYSLRARAGEDALAATTGNFVRTLPLALVAVFAAWGQTSISQRGAWLAALSGAMASGLGYAVWYAALRGLRRTSASLVQLSVPVLAAAGGVLLLGERLTSRFVLASLLTLGGIAAALLFGKDRN